MWLCFFSLLSMPWPHLSIEKLARFFMSTKCLIVGIQNYWILTCFFTREIFKWLPCSLTQRVTNPFHKKLFLPPFIDTHFDYLLYKEILLIFSFYVISSIRFNIISFPVREFVHECLSFLICDHYFICNR